MGVSGPWHSGGTGGRVPQAAISSNRAREIQDFTWQLRAY